MSRALYLLLLIGFFPHNRVQAQEAIPDTLDWHGYFPLKVNNSWQYYNESWISIIRLEEWYENWTVTEESLIDSMLFYTVKITCDSVYADSTYPYFSPSCIPHEEKQVLIRYDEERANIVERQTITPDSTVEKLWFIYDFDLSAPFYDFDPSEHLPGGGYEYGYEDELRLGGQRLSIPVKHISVVSAIPGGFSFAHSIGFLGSRFDEGGGTSQELVYAQIDGQEYGNFFRVDNDPRPGIAPTLSISAYPNPFRAITTLTIGVGKQVPITVKIIDMLGREVERLIDDKYLLPGKHDIKWAAEKYPAGIYLIELLQGDEERLVHQVILTK